LVELAEPGGERDGEQETGEDLHPGLGYPQLLQQLVPLPVQASALPLRGLVRAVCGLVRAVCRLVRAVCRLLHGSWTRHRSLPPVVGLAWSTVRVERRHSATAPRPISSGPATVNTRQMISAASAGSCTESPP